MAMKISEIPPEGLTLELHEDLELLEHGIASPVAVTAVLSIKPAGSGVLQIQGRAKANPLLQCSRCLNYFAYPVDTKLNLELAPLNSLETSPEHELAQGELDMDFYQGDEINPLELIQEQLLIALPMVPLHRPDCKGLCSICGTDLNETACGCRNDAPETPGAFSALKDLLKK